jgi:hypothetical protein
MTFLINHIKWDVVHMCAYALLFEHEGSYPNS